MLLIAVIAIVRELAGPPIPKPLTQAWFYDLNTGKLFAGPMDAVPPIPAPSGPVSDGSPAGVLAHVFGCTTCAEKSLKIAFLESRTPDASAKLKAWREKSRGHEAPMELRDAEEEGILVRRPADPSWVDQKSTAGRMIEDGAYTEVCPDNPRPENCYPGSH